MTSATGAGRLAGRVAVITGVAGGQGRAAALLFASEGATRVAHTVTKGGIVALTRQLAAEGAPLFLAADDASYVTGANLVVDGGWSAVLPGAGALAESRPLSSA